MTTELKSAPIEYTIPDAQPQGSGYYTVAICQWEGPITGFRIEASVQASTAPQLTSAELSWDVESTMKEYGRLGSSGYSGSPNLPYPYYYKGWMDKITAFTTAQTSVREAVSSPDVRMDTVVLTSNVISISQATNAVITLSVDPVYRDSQTFVKRTIVAGDVIFISADALGGYSRAYTVVSVNFSTRQITTDQDTSALPVAFKNSGRTTATVTVFATTYQTSPAYGLIGATAVTPSLNLPSIQFKKGSAILTALLGQKGFIYPINVR